MGSCSLEKMRKTDSIEPAGVKFLNSSKDCATPSNLEPVTFQEISIDDYIRV